MRARATSLGPRVLDAALWSMAVGLLAATFVLSLGVAPPGLNTFFASDKLIHAAGYAALADDDVVELEVMVGCDRDPERERGGILGAEHPPDRIRCIERVFGHTTTVPPGWDTTAARSVGRGERPSVPCWTPITRSSRI